MKIKKIEDKDEIYFVTYTPDFLERLFGNKEKVKKYKISRDIEYRNYPYREVFYDSSGEILNPRSEACIALNTYLKKKYNIF